MTVAIWAALAMVLQDIFAVIMVQMENRGRGWRAGALDAAGWLCALATNHFALNSLNQHSTSITVVVVLAVTAANVLGTVTGQKIGDHLFPDPVHARLEAIERWATVHGFVPPRVEHREVPVPET